MCNNFNTNVAVDFGVSTAIFVQRLYKMTMEHLARSLYIYDGHCWVYVSMEALKDYFPYWYIGNIRKVINEAIDAEVVVQANYNKSPKEDTLWFALTCSTHKYYPELQNSEVLLKPRSTKE